MSKCGVGYDDARLADLVYRKTSALHRLLSGSFPKLSGGDIHMVAAIAQIVASRKYPGRLSVVDFGGACGAHYFVAKKLFPEVDFDWRVVETQPMVRAARPLVTKELGFFSTLTDAMADLDGVAMVHASGVLQCVESPYDVLQELIRVGAGHLLVSRLPMTAEPTEVIVVHRQWLSANGPGPAPPDFEDQMCAYPLRCLVTNRIESTLGSAYEIRYASPDDSGRIAVEGHKIRGVSYFCRLRTDSVP